MDVEMWKIVAGAGGALVVGVLLHLLREGGLRRMRRRNITEELELLNLLAEHPEPAARIRKRVAVMLDQYEPTLERIATKRERLARTLEFCVLSLLALQLIQTLDVTSLWASGAIGGILALGVNVGHWVVGRRRDRNEQDLAVHSDVSLTATATITADGAVGESRSDSVDERTSVRAEQDDVEDGVGGRSA